MTQQANIYFIKCAETSHGRGLHSMAEAAFEESTGGLDTEPGDPVDRDLEDVQQQRGTEEDSVDNDDESVSSSYIHRMQSESKRSSSLCPEEEEGNLIDSYRRISRSQSDAFLLMKNTSSIMEAHDDFPKLLNKGDSSHNVSECSRVYLDLSRAEPFERVEFASENTVTMFRSSSGRQLETIPQDEELKTMDLSHLYASQRSLASSRLRSSSLEDVMPGSWGRISLTSSSPDSSASSSSKETLLKAMDGGGGSGFPGNVKACLQTFSHTVKQQVRALQMGSIPEQIHALQELSMLVEQAWSTPLHGRDLAYGLCDLLRTERALDVVVSNLSSPHRSLLVASAKLLDQALTTPNRNYLAHCSGMLDSVVKMTRDHQGDLELAASCTGILESLFKTSEQSCGRVIALGGLRVVVHWCRSHDLAILRHCAIALSNLALYGGADNQQEMIGHKAPEWLFPLAFMDDEVTRYYACLAMAALVSNKEIEPSVLQSGTLDLVPPFLRDHDPQQFAQRDPSHMQGRSPDWLRRLAPVLRSSRQEARALAAFTMVIEAGIKTEQGKKEVLYEVGAVEHLKWLASNPRSVATRLAAQALSILGEEVPVMLSLQVPLWSVDNVLQWLNQVGFGDFCRGFGSCQVDGDLLLRLTEKELKENLAMPCAITRKRFMRELVKLKMATDYASCDPTTVSDWLKQVGSEFTQYAYPMLQAGVDRRTLPSLSDTLLAHECGVENGIHRMKILAKIEEMRVKGSRLGSAQSRESVSACGCDGSGCKGRHQPIDVFLSYRRSNGSQLASLLKVHLQLRGFAVFIDIERLMTGKFDEQLLQSVRRASHLVVVLTPNALDRCVGDDQGEDWVHKEIAEALQAGVNIIPVTADGFRWPSSDSLPPDIKHLPAFNAVRWIHDYQDACVDKLEYFLRGEQHPTTPILVSSPSPQTAPTHHHHHTLPPPASPSSSSVASSSSSSFNSAVGHGTSCCCNTADIAKDSHAHNIRDADAAAVAVDDDNPFRFSGQAYSSSCFSSSSLLPSMGSSVDAGSDEVVRMNGVLGRSDRVAMKGGLGSSS